MTPPIQTQQVFGNLPDTLAQRLKTLRTLILETASGDPAIGPIEATLKWGEPAYLPSTTKSGTTIRINRHQKSDRKYAFYVSCQTDLVERYKELYDDVLKFDGKRAVTFDVEEDIPVDAVKHCIAMAMTYHLK